MPKLSKYDAYHHLSKYLSIGPRIPRYSILSQSNLSKLLSQSSIVFAKPDKLYRGKGVAKITACDSGYLLQFRNSGTNNSIFFKKLTTLVEKLQKAQGFIDERYVLQERIDLAKIMGNAFDIRVMLQKDPFLTWQVTGISARLAPVNSVVTSPRSGGKVAAMDEVLSRAFPGQETKILSELVSFSRQLGACVDQEFGFHGELGIDLGLDCRGNVWLIEINVKPLKVSLNRLQHKGLSQLIKGLPIKLGLSLDGFVVPCFKFPPNPELWPQCTLQAAKANGASPEIFLTLNQLKELGFSLGSQITLQVGETARKVVVRQNDSTSDPTDILLSDKLLAEYEISSNTRLCIINHRRDLLVLGPTVGMAVSTGAISCLSTDDELTTMAKLAREKGVFFFCFTPTDIDWANRKVKAYLPISQTNDWVTQDVPLPQVVYDRATLPSNSKKRRKAKQSLKRLSKDPGTNLVNSKRFFGKYETWEALYFFEQLRKALPQTVKLSQEGLTKMTKKHDTLYCKSNYGSHGNEVIRVETFAKHYRCRAGGSETKEWTFAQEDLLLEFLVEQIGEDSIIQQAVPLATIEDRPFDLRVHMQKNIAGKWQIPCLSVRITPEGGVVSNIAAGGTELIVNPLKEVFHPHFNWEKLWHFCRDVSFAVEASFGQLGEIGLDVGMGPRGRLWLFEVNSKPSINLTSDITEWHIRDTIYGLPFDYSKYLVSQMPTTDSQS